MARTTTTVKATKTAATKPSRPSIETKALAEENKSAGMRLLFEHGYSVTQVRTVFNAPYGYVYGVAQRAGFAETAAGRKTAKAAPAKATKAPAKVTKPVVAAKVAAKPVVKATKAVAAKPATVSKAKLAPPRMLAPASKPATTHTSTNGTMQKPTRAMLTPVKAPVVTKITRVAGSSAVARVAARLAAKSAPVKVARQ